MKIYNEVRIDMRTGIVEYEDSFMYSGPMIFMKGGGPSGTITFPTGITNAYQDYLGEDGSGGLGDVVDSSVIDLFNAALTSLGGDIMIDGGFDDSGSWNKGTGWAVAGSKATLTGNNSSDLSRTDLSLIAGATYQVVYTVTNMTLGDGTIKVRLQGGSFGTIRVNNGTFNENLIAGSGTSGEILFRGFADTSDDFDIDTVTIKTVTGSPYAGQTAYNPDVAQDETADSPLSDMQTRHDTLDTFVATLDEEVDWESMIDNVIAGSGITTLFPTYDIDARVTTLSAVDLTEANDAGLSATAAGLTAATLLADPSAAPHTDGLANAETTMDTATANALTNVALQMTAITTEAIADATIAFETNAHTKSKTITANLDTLGKAAAILDSDSVIGTINTTVMSKVTDMIATAVTAGITAVNATPLQDMVDAFEQRRKGQHFRAVNRFAGPLADAGAINSSAYIFGIASLESDFSREVSQFDAEASFRVYTEAISLYGNAFNSTFDSYLKLYSTEFTEYLKLYLSGLREYLNTYHVTLGKEIDSNDKMFTNETNLYSALSNSYIQAAIGYNNQQMATYRQLATSHIAAEVQSEFAIRNQKVAWFTNSVKDMVTMLSNRVNAESGTTQLQAEISRLKMISLKEQTDRDAELDSLDALWDIKLYQYVANVLGAPGGGSGFIPDLPNTGASALTGALGGAAVLGAATGGNPIALGIGAAVGGLAGLLE